MVYRLTRDALLLDLYAAFHCAKQHKATKPYVLRFERNLKENLEELRDALWNRTYQTEVPTMASNAFISISGRRVEATAVGVM